MGNDEMEAAFKSRTVFIVDDDRGLLRLIQKALQREGFATASAVSGSEALEWLGRNQAALMLLDLKLQDIEGKDLVERLGVAGQCPPFIIITGQGDERVAVEMMKRGARDYLVKDVDFLQFVPAVVKRALDQMGIQYRDATGVGLFVPDPDGTLVQLWTEDSWSHLGETAAPAAVAQPAPLAVA